MKQQKDSVIWGLVFVLAGLAILIATSVMVLGSSMHFGNVIKDAMFIKADWKLICFFIGIIVAIIVSAKEIYNHSINLIVNGIEEIKRKYLLWRYERWKNKKKN